MSLVISRIHRVSSVTLHPNALPILALMGAVLFWGSSFVGMRIAVQMMNPWSVMWCRMAAALVVILPFAGRIRSIPYQQGDWKRLLPMVLLQPCLYFFLEANALRLTTSSQAGVISASVPLLVAVGAWLFLKERFSGFTLAGLIMSVGGVVALTLVASRSESAVNPLVGNGMELAAMGCAAANMLMVKQLSTRYNPWTLTAMQVVAGAIFFLPGLGFILRDNSLAAGGPTLFLIVVGLGIFATLGAFGLYNWAMSRLPASRASIFINLVPVVAVSFGWGLLGEGLSAPQCVAAVVVVCGVWISQRSGGRR